MLVKQTTTAFVLDINRLKLRNIMNPTKGTTNNNMCGLEGSNPARNSSSLNERQTRCRCQQWNTAWIPMLTGWRTIIHTGGRALSSPAQSSSSRPISMKDMTPASDWEGFWLRGPLSAFFIWRGFGQRWLLAGGLWPYPVKTSELQSQWAPDVLKWYLFILFKMRHLVNYIISISPDILTCKNKLIIHDIDEASHSGLAVHQETLSRVRHGARVKTSALFSLWSMLVPVAFKRITIGDIAPAPSVHDIGQCTCS